MAHHIRLKNIYNNFKIKIFLFFAVYLIPALCSFRASILIHKSRLSQKRKNLNLNCRDLYSDMRFLNFERLSSTAGATQEAKYDSLYGYNLTGWRDT